VSILPGCLSTGLPSRCIWASRSRRCWRPGASWPTGDQGRHRDLPRFFQEMRRRPSAHGLSGEGVRPDPLLEVSDGAPRNIRAIEECLPRLINQLCLAHKMTNLQSKVPQDVWRRRQAAG
jgi:hypothetical protein